MDKRIIIGLIIAAVIVVIVVMLGGTLSVESGVFEVSGFANPFPPGPIISRVKYQIRHAGGIIGVPKSVAHDQEDLVEVQIRIPKGYTYKQMIALGALFKKFQHDHNADFTVDFIEIAWMMAVSLFFYSQVAQSEVHVLGHASSIMPTIAREYVNGGIADLVMTQVIGYSIQLFSLPSTAEGLAAEATRVRAIAMRGGSIPLPAAPGAAGTEFKLVPFP